VLDDGRLTDSRGRTVNFTNTIIIMTSNIGSDVILDWNGQDRAALENSLQAILRQSFRPEFLNRIDDTIVFNRVDERAMTEIVNRELDKVIRGLRQTKQIELDVDDDIKQQFAREGYDPSFGARPLRRLIQRQLLNPLAREIVAGNFQDGAHIQARLANGTISFSAR
jgi:ATP-dependent Clp protease ATP-binding subunit ClpB